MKRYYKKIIAPILVTILVILYFIVYGLILVNEVPGIYKYVFVIIPLILIIWMITILIERIKEIKGGEEDDLSQY